MQLAAAVASGVCVAIGAVRLGHSRLSAYRWFLRAVLVSILVFEVFAFYYAQFAALGSLVFDLLLYAALGYMIGRERTEAAAMERAGPGAVPAAGGVGSAA